MIRNKGLVRPVLSGLASLLVCSSLQAAELLFSDDFEDGNVSGWSASPANTASQERAFRGSWGLKYNSGGNTNGNMRRIIAGEQQVYVRFQWFPTSTFRCGAGAHFWRITHDFQSRQLDTQCTGSNSLEFVGFFGADVYPVGPSMRDIKINEWNLIEIFFKLNDVGQANGELKAWVNGVQHINRTNTTWRNSNDPISEVHINSNYNPAAVIWYFDDVEIWDDLPNRVTPQPPAVLTAR